MVQTSFTHGHLITKCSQIKSKWCESGFCFSRACHQNVAHIPQERKLLKTETKLKSWLEMRVPHWITAEAMTCPECTGSWSKLVVGTSDILWMIGFVAMWENVSTQCFNMSMQSVKKEYEASVHKLVCNNMSDCVLVPSKVGLIVRSLLSQSFHCFSRSVHIVSSCGQVLAASPQLHKSVPTGLLSLPGNTQPDCGWLFQDLALGCTLQSVLLCPFSHKGNGAHNPCSASVLLLGTEPLTLALL